jgi:hypothetical protein
MYRQTSHNLWFSQDVYCAAYCVKRVSMRGFGLSYSQMVRQRGMLQSVWIPDSVQLGKAILWQ